MVESSVSEVKKQKRSVRFAAKAGTTDIEEGTSYRDGDDDLETLLLPPVLEDVYEIPHIKDLTEDEIFDIWLQPVDYFTIYVDYSTLVDKYVAQENAFNGDGNATSMTTRSIMGCGGGRRRGGGSSAGCNGQLLSCGGGGSVTCRRRNCPLAVLKRHYYIHYTRPKYLAKQDITEDEDDEASDSSSSGCGRINGTSKDVNEYGGDDEEEEHDTEEEDILRGLEDLIPNVAHEKEAIIKKSIQAVLAEQELQRSIDIDTEEGNTKTSKKALNADSIATAYLKSIGRYVTRRAIEAALDDASHANRIYHNVVDAHENDDERVDDNVEFDVSNDRNSENVDNDQPKTTLDSMGMIVSNKKKRSVLITTSKGMKLPTPPATIVSTVCEDGSSSNKRIRPLSLVDRVLNE